MPAAQGETGDAGRADHAAGSDQAVGLGRLVEVDQVAPPPERAIPLLGVDVDRAHLGQVDDQAIVDGAGPAGLWPPPRTAISRSFSGEGERRRDVSASTQRAITAGRGRSAG